jgi:hypothetical protein
MLSIFVVTPKGPPVVAGIEDDWDSPDDEKEIPKPKVEVKSTPVPTKPPPTPKKAEPEEWDDDEDNVNLEDPEEDEFYRYVETFDIFDVLENYESKKKGLK